MLTVKLFCLVNCFILFSYWNHLLARIFLQMALGGNIFQMTAWFCYGLLNDSNFPLYSLSVRDCVGAK